MEQENNKLKVYKFEVTCLKKNEDGTVSPDERKTSIYGYTFEGDPSPRVEYNRYWEFGDGCLQLVSKDEHAIDSEVDNMITWLCDKGFRGVAIEKMIGGLDAPGKWAEVCLGDAVKTTLRVTRLTELPEIDPKATIRDSDLSPAQQHRVKIDGVPLFPEGGTVNASNPKAPTLVLRPELKRELGIVWEDFIRLHSSASVHVEVDTAYHNAASVAVKLTVKAPTRNELDSALGTIGVLHPQNIEPDVVEGEGEVPSKFTATVILATEV